MSYCLDFREVIISRKRRPRKCRKQPYIGEQKFRITIVKIAKFANCEQIYDLETKNSLDISSEELLS